MRLSWVCQGVPTKPTRQSSSRSAFRKQDGLFAKVDFNVLIGVCARACTCRQSKFSAKLRDEFKIVAHSGSI